MNEEFIKIITENIFSLGFLFKKKLLQNTYSFKKDISPSHFHIIFILNEFGCMSISELGRKLDISRPNMTPLLDRLIEEGFVERHHEVKDRRIIKIGLTEAGKGFLENNKNVMTQIFWKKLEVLEKKDLECLSEAVVNFRKIISKL